MKNNHHGRFTVKCRRDGLTVVRPDGSVMWARTSVEALAITQAWLDRRRVEGESNTITIEWQAFGRSKQADAGEAS